MPEYAGFLREFFRNHWAEDGTQNHLRYFIAVRMMFEVEEGVYTAGREEIEKLFEAYDGITGRNGQSKRKQFVPGT